MAYTLLFAAWFVHNLLSTAAGAVDASADPEAAYFRFFGVAVALMSVLFYAGPLGVLIWMLRHRTVRGARGLPCVPDDREAFERAFVPEEVRRHPKFAGCSLVLDRGELQAFEVVAGGSGSLETPSGPLTVLEVGETVAYGPRRGRSTSLRPPPPANRHSPPPASCRSS